MSGLFSRSSERLARSVLLAVVALGATAPLVLFSPRTRWWQDPRFALAAVVLTGALALRGELMPELSDGWFVERANRYSPFAAGLLIPVSLLFPTLGTWYLLWLLWAVGTVLLAFSYVPRVRTVTLCVFSALALGMVVVDPRAAPALAPLGVGWVLIPSLDRLANVRLRLVGRPAATFGPALRAGGALLSLGAAVFAAAWLLLPRSTRDYEVVDLLAPREGGHGAVRDVPIELPSLELFGLLVLILVVFVVVARAAGQEDSDAEPLPEPGGMAVGAGRALSAEELERAVEGWPRGPRRDLVESYLHHLQRLAALGYAIREGATPASHAARVARRLPAEVRELPQEIAEAFGRARWDPAPVDPASATELLDATADVEDHLL